MDLSRSFFYAQKSSPMDMQGNALTRIAHLTSFHVKTRPQRHNFRCRFIVELSVNIDEARSRRGGSAISATRITILLAHIFPTDTVAIVQETERCLHRATQERGYGLAIPEDLTSVTLKQAS